MSKRTACDRCRLQKLRCPPGDNDSVACARCQRLGAACSLAYRRESHFGLSFGDAPLRAPGEPTTPNSAVVTTSVSADALSAYVSGHGHAVHHPHHMNHMQQHQQGGSKPGSASASAFTSNGINMFASMGMDETFPEVSDFLAHEYGGLASPLPSAATVSGDSSSIDHTGMGREMQESAANGMSEHQSRQSDRKLRLMSLNLNLAARMQKYRHMSASDQGRSFCQLFEDALADLSEFLVIIQSCSSERASDSPNAGSNRSSVPRIGIVTVLNIMSTYFQIVDVYDKLWSALWIQISDRGGTSGPELATFFWGRPDSPRSSELQAKILIHAVLRQFETIERSLGLPFEMRVTEKRDAYAGLFKDEQARSLLDAVSLSGSSPGEDDTRREMQAVLSLRDTSKKLQMYLGI